MRVGVIAPRMGICGMNPAGIPPACCGVPGCLPCGVEEKNGFGCIALRLFQARRRQLAVNGVALDSRFDAYWLGPRGDDLRYWSPSIFVTVVVTTAQSS